MIRSSVRITVVLALMIELGGCVTVHPWQRGERSDPVMQPELLPEQIALDQHFLVTVEASAGGYAVAGGGCGCN